MIAGHVVSRRKKYTGKELIHDSQMAERTCTQMSKRSIRGTEDRITESEIPLKTQKKMDMTV